MADIRILDENDKRDLDSRKADKSNVVNSVNGKKGNVQLDIRYYDQDISQIWEAVNNKAFKTHTHLPTDIYINSRGETLDEIKAKHIDFDGWYTVEDILHKKADKVTVNASLSKLEENKANKVHTHSSEDIFDYTNQENQKEINSRVFVNEGKIADNSDRITSVKWELEDEIEVVEEAFESTANHIYGEIEGLFQSGVERNKQAVDILNSKNIEASTNDSLKINIDKFKNTVSKGSVLAEGEFIPVLKDGYVKSNWVEYKNPISLNYTLTTSEGVYMVINTRNNLALIAGDILAWTGTKSVIDAACVCQDGIFAYGDGKLYRYYFNGLGGHTVVSYTTRGLPVDIDSFYASKLTRYLYEGLKHYEVYILQHTLQKEGFYAGVLDGHYGRGTTNSVIDFQRKHKLEADGHCGPATRRVVNNYIGNSTIGLGWSSEREIGYFEKVADGEYKLNWTKNVAQEQVVCEIRQGIMTVADKGGRLWCLDIRGVENSNKLELGNPIEAIHSEVMDGYTILLVSAGRKVYMYKHDAQQLKEATLNIPITFTPLLEVSVDRPIVSMQKMKNQQYVFVDEIGNITTRDANTLNIIESRKAPNDIKVLTSRKGISSDNSLFNGLKYSEAGKIVHLNKLSTGNIEIL